MRTKGEIEESNGHGGARRGAGRPINPETKRILDKHLGEYVIVKERRHGQVRRVKKRVYTAILDELLRQAMTGDLKAIKAYLNVTLGKPRRADGSKARSNPLVSFKYIALPKYDTLPKLLKDQPDL
ncbi:MAG: hypothetical protein WA051_00275 [Minisyncoccia bacterium]